MERAIGNYPRQLYDPCCVIGGVQYRECSYIFQDTPHDACYMMVANSPNAPDLTARGIAKFSQSTGQVLRAVLVPYSAPLTSPLIDIVSSCIRPPKSNSVFVMYSLLTAANVTPNTTYFTELDADSLAFIKKSQTPGDVGYVGGGLCFPAMNTVPPGEMQASINMCASEYGRYIFSWNTAPNICLWDTIMNKVSYFDLIAMGYNISCGNFVENPQFWCFDKAGLLNVYVGSNATSGNFQPRIDQYTVTPNALGPQLTLHNSFNVNTPDNTWQQSTFGFAYLPDTDEFLAIYRLTKFGNLQYYVDKISNVTKAIAGTYTFGPGINPIYPFPLGGAHAAQYSIWDGVWLYDGKIVGQKENAFNSNWSNGFYVMDLRDGTVTTYDLSLWPADPANNLPTNGLYFSSVIYNAKPNTIWTQHFNGFISSGGQFTYQGFGIYGFPNVKNFKTLVPLPPPSYALGPRGSMV